MKKYLPIFLFCCLIGVSCSEDDQMYSDPGLYGEWYDFNNFYYYFDDNSYAIKNRRVGNANDPVTTDSIWGFIEINEDRDILTYNVQGYMRKDGTVVNEALNSTVWSYEIQDTTLSYSSKTTLGEIYRR